MEYEPCLQGEKRPSLQKLSGPDGAEAWCVAFGACLINFIMAGLARMSGILFVAFIDIFQIERRHASLPSSIRMSTRNLLGPAVGILGQKYGVRSITVLGGIVGTVSAAACFFTTEFVWITVVWGIISGTGSALLTTLPQVVIGQHFKKYRTTAAGIAFSGGCVGSFLFPALLEFLLYKYGLNGTFLLISGIMMHTIPAAMILHKPTWLRQSARNSIKIFTVGSSAEMDRENAQKADSDLSERQLAHMSTKFLRKLKDSDIVNEKARDSIADIDCERLRHNSAVVVEILEKVLEQNPRIGSADLPKGDLTKDWITMCDQIELLQCYGAMAESKKTNGAGMHLAGNDRENEPKGINDSSNHISKLLLLDNQKTKTQLPLEYINFSDENNILQHFPEERHPLISSILTDMKRISIALSECRQCFLPTGVAERTIPVTGHALDDPEESNTFLVHIKTALKLYLKPMYILISLCRVVHFVMLVTLLTTVVDFAMDKGLPEEDGKYVIAALSAGDLMGRMCFGWVTDKGYVSEPRVLRRVSWHSSNPEPP